MMVGISCLAQSDRKKPNLAIFDEQISRELEKYYYTPDLNRNLQFIFFVVIQDDFKGDKTAAREFLTSVIKKTAKKNSLSFSIAKDSASLRSDSAFNAIYLSVVSLETSYPKFLKNRFLGEKTIERLITGNVYINLRSSDGRVALNDRIAINYTDEIKFDNYESYETDEYPFTVSEPPEVNSFEEVIVPASIVITSIIATILFFYIRTK